ncbi:nitrogen regulation protein NR(II) [Paraburkholderia unamae]|uniref:Sensory histidine kinase/phosphatase NtrB n=1 Tax=Paraburkholderia unamae TaxID=219649 RepID=A0ABX5KAP9_9BURK|nr:nitrogen regulation protein NR(II) [Paraburkholderia unamae]PVX72029.1 two-component system nitrogen regulation sensor histidine kinase GlnL [Paraburkholderia unamae]RAR52466.1 two-component system nitrogen regulation sensor histidine kinase GlnL [Paraburkholderia unamae]CAG9267148.1 sensory histidine kinase NtrB [Paraburkholderia unamae]
MVLKNLIKARKGHAEPLSDDAPLVDSGLLPGFEALPTVVLVLDKRTLRVAFANPSAEAMLDLSRRQLAQMAWSDLFSNADELLTTIASIAEHRFHATRLDASLERPGREPLNVHAIVGFLESAPDYVLLELFENERHLRSDREERIHDLTAVNKHLIRNLAHEIKNPLGGIRGAAQLLEFELGALERDELREYTQVVIKESDRLQTLVDRLLEPHRHPHIVGDVNIHEVCERVRAVILAEFPRGLTIERDYDVSVPDLRGDKEQLIQALLNIVRNAAQALRERISQGDARIELRTRIARKVTISKRLCKLALDLHITDNGPGIPEEIRDRIFYPLVSGREDGSGLGLTLAQTFVQQHDGLIEVDSRPGHTEFQILLPLDN